MSSTYRSSDAPADRWYVLAVLTCAYALNIADRFSISTVLEPLRTELKLTDTGTAVLTAWALGLFYVTIGIPIAAYADRANRRNILVAALAVWSAMTALCGLAQNYWQLLLARFGVGIGEAGGTAPSTALLADKFPPARRPLALTIFALGACLGAWLGSSVTAAVAEHSGWRASFLVLGVPGLLLAAIVWGTVREPPRGALDRTRATAGAGFRETVRYFGTAPSALHLVIGGAVATLWSWGLMWWTPAFLQRAHHLSVGAAGALLGPMHLIAGTASTLAAGWLMSRRAASDPRYVARLLALIVALCTIPSLLAYAVTPLASARLWLWLFVPGVYFYIGPILGLLQNVIPAGMRATACALLLFLANVGNLVVAPYVVGWLSDGFQSAWGVPNDESLRWALLLLAPTGFWAAWHLWLSGRTIRADQARVIA
jgi:predicted MFS family arabinose efflux permease